MSEPLALPAPADAVPVDAFGTAFRAGFHRANPDGTPFRGKRGQFMPKGGRHKLSTDKPPGGPVPPPSDVPPPVQAAPAPEPAKADFADVAKIVGEHAKEEQQKPANAPVEVVGELTLESSWDASLRGGYAIAGGIFRARDEWSPEKSEHEQLRDAWASTARAYGWKPFPPIIPAIFASIAFVWNRITAPKTAKTLVKWFPGLAPILGVEVPEEKKPEEKKPAQPLAVKPAAPVSARAETFFGG